MNYHDSERILSHLKEINIIKTETLKEADLIIFNTCTIRDLANHKFASHLGEMKHLKQENPHLIIGVCGCIAQIEGKKLIKGFPQVDFVFGTDAIDQVNDMIKRVCEKNEKFSINAWDRGPEYSIETKITHDSPQAFVNIIKGCNKYCSYCIVPYTRGKERSRRLSEVVEDVKRLVDQHKIQEITLLGQNVNSFGKENKESLPELIMALEPIENLNLIRYITAHPYDLSDELIEVHRTSSKLAMHLHLPVQSGSNTVLQRMNRDYTSEHFLNICRKLREAQPDLTLSTDIIVGFPNETDDEFQQTVDLLDKAQFDFIYSFLYSPRERTKAAKMTDSISESTRKDRLQYLQQHQLKIQSKLRSKLVGKTVRVLVEKKQSMKGLEKWKGRTSCNRIVHFSSPNIENLQWHWTDVKITSTTALSCQGELIQNYGKTLP